VSTKITKQQRLRWTPSLSSPAPSRWLGGRFAPGHLGELTQLLPFEMVDEALRATGTVQARLRDLPSRVVVYLLLAACMFPEVGYLGVWCKLTTALTGLPTAAPTAGALAQARRRVGPAPLRWLFDLLRDPVAAPGQRGTWWRGLLVCAIDGTTLTVPDNPRMLTRFTKGRGNHGGTGYPQVRLVALLACGTRTVIDAVFGPTTTGETGYVPRLPPSLEDFQAVAAADDARDLAAADTRGQTNLE
jgi:Insertion element 4 transposase N-terminal